MAEPSAELPFLRIGSETPAIPVVLSVPHAGRAYSTAILKSSRLSRETLATLEDRLMDRLVWRAVATGSATAARAPGWVEVNIAGDCRTSAAKCRVSG